MYYIVFLDINFSKQIKTLLNGIYGLWNSLIDASYEKLLLLPADIEKMPSTLNSINSMFAGVATSLLVLFFLIGFCSETTNVREEMRFDTIARYLVRLIAAEYFVIHSKEILMLILEICKLICENMQRLFLLKKTRLRITPKEEEAIDGLGFVSSIVVLIVIILLAAILIFLGCSIVWSIYTRFLKVCLMIPFATLAFATMAGPSGGEVSRISSSYIKAFLANAISSIVIAAALIFGTIIMGGIKIDLPTWGMTNFMPVIGILLNKLLQASVLVACVKEAEYLTERMMGAY